jgi:hypothetical protein
MRKLLGSTLLVLSSAVAAHTFPSKPVRLISGVSPGAAPALPCRATNSRR